MAASPFWKSMIVSAVMLVSAGHISAEPADQNNDGPKKEQREKRDAKRDKGEAGGEKAKANRADNEEREKRRAQRREEFFQHLFKDLGFSDEQKTQARTVVEEAEKQQKAWRDQHKDELRAIREEMNAARRAKDKEAGKAAHEKLAALMKDAPVQDGIPTRLRDMLSEDQIKQVQKNVKEIRELEQKRRQERRANRGDDKDDQKAERPQRKQDKKEKDEARGGDE